MVGIEGDFFNDVTYGLARVSGFVGLRVADGNSFPIIIPGQPVGALYSLAERISDYIFQGDDDIYQLLGLT